MSANVRSIAVLERVRHAMQAFGEDAGQALSMAAMVIARYLDWIEHDRVKYWENQVRRGFEQIAECRADLERCESLALEGQRKTCHEEKEALDAAKRRLRRAEEQLEAVRHWRNKLQHEVAEYRARVGQLGGWLESDHPKAVAALERMHASLLAYVEMQAPSETAATSAAPSMARAEPPPEIVADATARPDDAARTPSETSERPQP